MTFIKGGGLFSILMLAFVVWIFLAENGQGRIDRACKPVSWTGSFAESITDLTYPQHSNQVDRWVDSMEFSCNYMIWRLFYESEWIEAQEEMQNQSGNTNG